MRFAMYSRFNSMANRIGLEATADFAAEMGFAAVEVLESTGENHPVLIPDVETAKKAKAVLAERGLTVACYSVGSNLYHSPEAVESLMKQAEIAAALDCPFLHHTLLPILRMTEGMPSFEEGIAVAVEAAGRVADFAKPLGIRCIYEDQGLYANGVEGFGVFYRQMKQNCSNIGVCGDIGNSLFVDEGAEKFFAAYAEDICHVHIKDYLRKSVKEAPGKYWLPTRGGNWLRDTLIGDGVVDFDACMQILKNVGYDGVYALENEHPEPFEEGVKQAMNFLGRWDAK